MKQTQIILWTLLKKYLNQKISTAPTVLFKSTKKFPLNWHEQSLHGAKTHVTEIEEENLWLFNSAS